MNAHFISDGRRDIYGFDSFELRLSARRQLGVSSLILACFGVACALTLAM